MRALVSTADQMDNFVAVARRNLRCRPIRARKNFKIAFDGHALSANVQVREQARNVEAFRNLLQISIDCDFDWHI
jgi:hypothetical protein